MKCYEVHLEPPPPKSNDKNASCMVPIVWKSPPTPLFQFYGKWLFVSEYNTNVRRQSGNQLYIRKSEEAWFSSIQKQRFPSNERWHHFCTLWHCFMQTCTPPSRWGVEQVPQPSGWNLSAHRQSDTMSLGTTASSLLPWYPKGILVGMDGDRCIHVYKPIS